MAFSIVVWIFINMIIPPGFLLVSGFPWDYAFHIRRERDFHSGVLGILFVVMNDFFCC